MPSLRRSISHADVLRVCAESFACSEQDLVGLESEWPVWGGSSADGRPGADLIERLDGRVLQAGGRLTFEPGGQVELSTQPFRNVSDTLRAARIDTAAIHDLFKDEGYVCRTSAVDVLRAPRRVLDRPRYQAMESFFGHAGQAGTWMMCNTASTQVNVSHAQHDPFERWHLLTELTPVLIACFANSPGRDRAGRSWASLRQGIWASIDPSRTSPVRPRGQSPIEAWSSFVSSADVMVINSGADAGTPSPVRPGFTLGAWMESGHPRGWPTEDDLRYHMTTLFPPVRPRGWLEVRVLDALPTWLSEACALVITTACVPEAARELRTRLPDVCGLGLDAARHGLQHPQLRDAATRLIEVVNDHVQAVTSDTVHLAALDEFAATYVRAGRCPADDGTRLRLPVSLRSEHELLAV